MADKKSVKLHVVEALQDDAYKGIARLDAEVMRELDVRRGDVILIKGNRETVAIADRAYPADVGEGIIRIDGILRKNAKTGIGDVVTISKVEVKEAKKIMIAPAQKGIMVQAEPENLRRGLLGRTLVKGDIVVLGGVQRRRDLFSEMGFGEGLGDIFGDELGNIFGNLGGAVAQIRFLVVNTSPNQPVIVSENTEVVLNPKAVEVSEENIPEIAYEDIGGLDDEIKKIREMVEIPMKHPEIFQRLGIEPPKGVLLHGPPGTGKTLLAKAVANESEASFILLNGPEVMCVGGDTPIFTNPQGYIKAKQVYEQKGEDEKFRNYILKRLDNPISTFSFKDGKIEKSNITHVTKLNAKSFYVRLSDGNEIVVSENQPFLVYRNGDLVWKPIKNIKKGDFVARLNNVSLPEESYEFPFEKLKEKFELDEQNNMFVIKSRNLFRSNFIKLPNKTNPELLELIGLVVSDGNINSKGDSIGFYNKDLDLINRFKFLVNKVFGVDKFKEKNDRGIFGVIVYSKLLVEYLRLLGFTNENKENVPSYFFKLSKNEVRAFVRGYFDGDGTVSQLKIQGMVYPTPVLYSVNKGFLIQLQSLLLLKLGIQCKIKEHKTPMGLMHKLVVRGNEGRIKFLEIGATSKSKFAKLKEIKKVIKVKEHENIPHPSILIESIRKDLPYKKYRNKDYYIYQSGNATKHSLNLLYDIASENNLVSPAVKKEFDLLQRDDIGWEKVEDIKDKGEQELYDFTVDKDSFIGSPYFFLHNSKFYGESEKKIRDIFEEANKTAPAIIFIDELDAVAPKREEVTGEVERRVVSQILTMMDGLKSRGKVIVIGATNRVNAIDPALRRPGRFDREIEVGVPSKKGRLSILKIHTRGMPLSKDVNLEEIAGLTHGFVGADLESLSKEAAMSVLRKILPKINLDNEDSIPSEMLEKLIVKQKDFMDALKIVRPSAMREVLVETPNIKWNDIGGLEGIKRELREAVEWPLKYPESFERMGIRPPRGILLYGPPGTGKTLLAKAVANESEANFIQVKGPSLLCVAKDTPIISSLCGLQKIENFYNLLKENSVIENKDNVEYLLPKKEIFVQALKNKEIDFSKVVRAYKLNVKDAYKITFKDNNTLEVSGNQPFLTFNDSPEWIKTRDLKEGDLIAYPNKIKLFNKQIEIDVPDNKNIKIIEENADFNLVRIFSSHSETKLPKFIDKNLAEFLGWFASEGGISKEKGFVKVYNINKENRKRIKELFELFVSKDRVKEFEKGIGVYSAPLIYYFEELFGQKFEGKKSYSIKVPKRMFFENEKNIQAFLRGAWKGDGHVDDLKAEYGSMSEELAQGISYLLTFLGIRYKLWHRKDNMFMITISGKEDLINFKDLIFNQNSGIEVRQFYNAHLILPKIANILMKLKEISKLKYSRMEGMDGYLPEGLFEAVVSGRREVGVHRLKKIIAVLEEKLSENEKGSEEFKTLKFLVESKLLWMKIKKTEKAEEQVMYDIETEDGSFIGGKRPLLLHNSMWVGKSEEGVRKVFERARQVAPCIIFFDEIDALAGKRGIEMGTRVTERVLNQLLAEMDGLEDLNDVLVIGATNRPDMLDPGLLRPGRFDKILLVQTPTEEGRENILRIHTKRMPLAKDVSISELAKKTDGYTGADLESFAREAALLALREDIESKQVKKKHFEEAYKKVKPSVTKMTIDAYKKIEESFLRTAKAAIPTESSYFG